MSLLTNSAIGTILDNYADVIEGGNTYASGTSFKGIPGTRTYHTWVSGNGAGLNVSGGSSTTVALTGVPSGVAGSLVTTDAPPFFLLCTAQAAGSRNVGAARKVLSHDGTDTFTTPAFPEAVASGDTFTILEGFKRNPDNFEIEDEEAGSPQGFDRFFHLKAHAGERLTWYGDGVEQYQTTLEVRMRFLKRSRAQEVSESALENILRLRSILTRPEHRDGCFAQLLQAEGTSPEVEFEDKSKIVVLDTYNLIYRVTSTYL